ncbi:hypothetical protein IKF21_00905 [Candidatus Saccharibacteria bacterium]|nr:hypothetical protein [Candidatus Saccharibacteria bacterium]
MESENVMTPEAPKTDNSATQEAPKIENTAVQEKPNDEPVGEKTKMSKKQVIGLVVLSMIALGGVLFGIYGMNSQNDQIAQLTVRATDAEGKVAQLETNKITIEQPDGNIVEVKDNRISNELANNLIKPYLGTFTYLNDIFDHEFNENTKFYVAFNNLKDVDRRGESILYDEINKEYKYLFGDSKDLDKTNYEEGYNIFTYNTESWGGGKFTVEQLGGGGIGVHVFSIVKDAYYDGDSIIVEVYHGRASGCGMDGGDDTYCLDGNGGYHTTSDTKIEQLFNDDRTEIYKMSFTKNNDHYALDSINK